MTSAPNLFPVYPVATLGSSEPTPTVMTAGIEQITRLVSAFLSAESQPTQGLNVPIKGEFGTGKTHLLAFASRQLVDEAAERTASASVITAAGVETDPEGWYHLALGPQLATVGLEEMLLGLFAEAAKSVAGLAPLTSGVVASIEQSPGTARTLVRDELLSPSDVEVAFIDLLERTFGDAGVEISVEVRRALTSAIWQPTLARRWLSGERLSGRQQADAGLPATLTGEDLASDAIVAVAAVAKHLAIPFAVVLDELEHFLRYDENAHGKRNVTWLKRLLERLMRCGALVLVAGQSAAWQGHPDFLDRFSPGVEIELLPLTGLDVLTIVSTIEGFTGTFELQSAERVAELCDGNIRRILGTLHALYERTGGFTSEITDDQIQVATAKLALRVDPERALADLARTLTADFGLDVEAAAVAGGLEFDLVGRRNAEPLLVVELKYAPFGQKQQDQVRRFIDRVRALSPLAPNCIGCFLSASPLDTSLRDTVARSEAPIVLVDLTEPGYLERLTVALGEHLAVDTDQPPAGDADENHDSDDQLQRLEAELRKLKDDQASFYTDLQERLARSGDANVTNVAFQPAAAEDLQDVRRRLYEDLSAPPPRAQWLGRLFEVRALPVFVGFVLGIALVILSSSLATSISERGEGPKYSGWRAAFLVAGILLIAAASFGVARVYVLVERFHSFKKSLLRELYLRDNVPLDFITTANGVIDTAFVSYGPQLGQEVAARRLAELGQELGVPIYSGSIPGAAEGGAWPAH
jgi:hypothetical protein